MQLGVAPPTFATDGWRLPASRLDRFVRRAEALDFDGVWVTEHLLHPPNRNYSRLAPLTTLATIAGAAGGSRRRSPWSGDCSPGRRPRSTASSTRSRSSASSPVSPGRRGYSSEVAAWSATASGASPAR